MNCIKTHKFLSTISDLSNTILLIIELIPATSCILIILTVECLLIMEKVKPGTFMIDNSLYQVNFPYQLKDGISNDRLGYFNFKEIRFGGDAGEDVGFFLL
jgi:hypothetical protein